MKSADFARYIHMGIVGHVYISDKSSADTCFEVYARGVTEEYDHYIAIHGRWIDVATGNRRQWQDLTEAYQFIVESGWIGKVFVEIGAESFAEA